MLIQNFSCFMKYYLTIYILWTGFVFKPTSTDWCTNHVQRGSSLPLDKKWQFLIKKQGCIAGFCIGPQKSRLDSVMQNLNQKPCFIKKKKNFILPMILLRCSRWDFHGKGFSIFLVFSCHSSRISLLSSLVEWNDCVFFRWFTILKRRKLNLDHSRLLNIFSLDLKKKKKIKESWFWLFLLQCDLWQWQLLWTSWLNFMKSLRYKVWFSYMRECKSYAVKFQFGNYLFILFMVVALTSHFAVEYYSAFWNLPFNIHWLYNKWMK